MWGPDPMNPTVRATLRDLAAAGARPLDLAMGRWLAARAATDDPDAQAALALTGALLAWAEREGHIRVRLAAWAAVRYPGEADDPSTLPVLPTLDAWTAALDASGLAGPLDAARPLVVEATPAGPTVAFYRLAAAERRVGVRLAALAVPDPFGDAPDLAAAFAEAFPSSAGDRQALAVAAALHGRLTAIAGGPGTGKTYTVARLLALARAARPGLRIALAAPTGKAAQRLTESVGAQIAAQGVDVPEATTLHRLLGVRPRGGWVHGPASPLPADLVIVDEASMVGLALMDGLLGALAPSARLVLLGDPHQLASVEAGAVFGDLCAAGDGGGADLAAFAAGLGMSDVPSADDASPLASPLASSVVTLTESRRFTAASGIGAVARAVQAGDASASRDAFARFADVRFVPGDASANARAWALPFARAVAAAATPAEALAALERFRLLAATRRGPTGVEGLNAALEATLESETGGRVRAGRFYRGRPLLVTANDPHVGLFNGDLGVAWLDGEDRVLVVPVPGGLRHVPFVRVPPAEAAWAMTVHKSQGSEADAVGLVLPPAGHPAAGRLTRELLYTAITRARREATVFGEAAVWDDGVRRRTERTSGLAGLWA